MKWRHFKQQANIMDSVLAAVRAHCTSRYNERYGYSAVVECFDDDELSELLEHTNDETIAIKLIEEYVTLVSDHHDDVATL